MTSANVKGLHELADRVWAYLPGRATWCYSNAGLVAGDATSLLVDTMIDLRLTQEMLDTMRPITADRPLEALLNTHADPDHCFGNELMPSSAHIYATTTTAEGMAQQSPAGLRDRLASLPAGAARDFVTDMLAPFAVDEVTGRLPDRTFAGHDSLTVGTRRVEFLELGPAHSPSDVVALVPDAGVLFTGDLVFVGSTPVSWVGSFDRWLAACDKLCALEADVIVPGHGPVTDRDGVREVASYFTYIRSQIAELQSSGLSSLDAALAVDLGGFADWTDPERVVVTVDRMYAELDAAHVLAGQGELYAGMAEYRRRRGLR